MKSPKDMRIIQIDITNACMYQCSNCTRFCGHHKKNFFMDFETFQRAVDSMKGYHGTIGVMGGEPTLHPEFERFVKYLHSQLSEGSRKDNHSLVKPQKDFIESILLENKIHSEVYQYETGARETVVGAGLWSAMVPTYKKYYELIQDVFKMQAVNDHGNTMYHSPILINRKDLGIPDDKWIQIRDNCWAQDVWSATITPKGAFFCEIAGALDMLFDGPGGWPIEEGWWKRRPEEFGDQLRWCEYCGIAIETFTRDANDWIDDVSESMYKKLKEIDSPKIKKPERINLVQIKDGVIAKKSKVGAKEVRRELFYDSFASRFNGQKSVLYPESFDAIVDINHKNEILEIEQWMESQGRVFESIFLIVFCEDLYNRLQSLYSGNRKIGILKRDAVWGRSYAYALRHCHALQPIWYFSDLLYIKENFYKSLKDTVINPGTLHYVDLRSRSCDCLERNAAAGVLALFHKEAVSLKRAGMDFIANAGCFDEIIRVWDTNKIVPMSWKMIEDSSGMRIQSNKVYAVYGAGITGHSALRQIWKNNSEAVFFVDTNPEKWGMRIEGIAVESPQELINRRKDYSQIVIASTYFKEIKEKLEAMGFGEEDYVIFE